MIVGLGKAAELVSEYLDQYSSRMREIRDYLEERLVVSYLKWIYSCFKALNLDNLRRSLD